MLNLLAQLLLLLVDGMCVSDMILQGHTSVRLKSCYTVSDMLQVNRNKRSEMKYFDLTHVFSNLICILNKMKMKMDSTRKESTLR